MKSFLGSAFLLCCSVIVVPSAHAHTPYLVPVSFEPAYEDWVSLDAGFAEEFFHPDVAFEHGNFQILTPAGQWQNLRVTKNLKFALSLNINSLIKELTVLQRARVSVMCFVFLK